MDLIGGKAELCLARSVSSGHDDYHPDAVVPRLPWRCAGHSDLGAPNGASRTSHAKVLLRSICTTYVSPLINAGLRYATSEACVSALLNTREFERAYAQLIKHIRSLTSEHRDFRVLGFAVKRPGLLTTTVNSHSGQRVGIHVDNWDSLPLSRRREARTRLCLNLSAETRTFLISDRPIDLLHQKHGAASERNLTMTVRHAAQNEPIEVMRIFVPPGAAYVAPTELLPHDSSTLGRTQADITLTFLGHFLLPT